MPTSILIANPPKKTRRKGSKPKGRKKTRTTTQEKPVANTKNKSKSKSKNTPKKRKGGGSAGFGGGGRGFLNTELLLTGSAAGGGFLAATIFAPQIGAKVDEAIGSEVASTPIGQIGMKAVGGLTAAWVSKRFLPAKFNRYGAAFAVGMVASAAVDVYDMVNPGDFMRLDARAGSALNASTGVAGFYAPGQYSANSVNMNRVNKYSPYGSGLRIGA